MNAEHRAFDRNGVPFFDGARVRFKGKTFVVEGIRTPRCLGDEHGFFPMGKDRYHVEVIGPHERGTYNFAKPVIEVWEGEKVKEAVILNPSDKPVERRTAMSKKQVVSKEPAKKIAGRTTGLGVDPTWCIAFERSRKERWADAKITAFMKSEFPDRKSRIFETGVQRVRSLFNKGSLHGQEKKPAQPAERYDKPSTNGGTKKKKVVVVRKK